MDKRFLIIIALFVAGAGYLLFGNSDIQLFHVPAFEATPSGVEPTPTLTEPQELELARQAEFGFEVTGNPIPEEITHDGRFNKTYYGDGNEYNGYYWEAEHYWIPGMITYESQFMEMPLIFSGDAWAYSPNMMEATAKFRKLTVKDVRDGVAIPICSPIGRYVWIKRPDSYPGGGEWEGAFKVVDCGQLDDIYGQITGRKEAIEVGFETAMDWKMAYAWEAGEIWHHAWDYRKVENVIVSFIPPECLPDDLSAYVVPLEEWFLERVRFQDFADNTEAEAYWSQVPRMLYRGDETTQQPMWRIPGVNDNEWVAFDLSIPECWELANAKINQ